MDEKEKRQVAMFGITLAKLKENVEEMVTEYGYTKKALAVSMLSDIQEMLTSHMDRETVRQTLNRAKWIINESN